MQHIAIFASGAGSNAEKIIQHFNSSATDKNKPQAAEVVLIVCNKPGAGVLQIAARENIPAITIEKEKFFRGNNYIPELNEYKIDLIVLAGFLWKIPDGLIKAFPGSIINIHPALLPKYGGKGMYGGNVHQAVLDNKETKSGITIHYVDEHYDNGDIIFQEECVVMKDDTTDSLAARIHKLEHAHYPVIIEKLIAKNVRKGD
jgi:phosphoribosylglycinamide formyltransferase 1